MTKSNLTRTWMHQYGLPEGPGLKAVAEGFGQLGLRDDREVLAQEFIVYDALYANGQQQVKKGRVA